MNFAAAKQSENFITNFLQAQAALYSFREFAGHRNGIGITEKIRGMQHVNMQRMAFDPFATIHQAPQCAATRVYRNVKSLFDRVQRGHLIGNRTNAADSSSDIGSLFIASASQESFKKSGRLKDLQFYIRDRSLIDSDLKRAFSFHTRESVTFYNSRFHDGFLSHRWLSSRNAPAQQLNPR